MTTNRSTEELAMRDALEAWGRSRWPDARVVHELVTDGCRIDMAFIRPDHLIGVEIKSSRDKLDRLDKQLGFFIRHLPEVWLALAPCWLDKGWSLFAFPGRYTPVVVEPDAPAPRHPVQMQWSSRGEIDRTVTSAMLALLWRGELLSIAVRKRLLGGGNRRETCRSVSGLLARALTGDEIVTEACRELRGRDAFWRADPPIRDDAVPVPAPRSDLFRTGVEAKREALV